MKRSGKHVFFIVALLIIGLTYTAFFGVYTPNGDLENTIIRGVKDIRWGIDIQGGVEVTLGPKGNAEGTEIEASEKEIEQASSIVSVRLVDQNITDYDLYTDTRYNRIIVSFPFKGEDQNAEETVAELAASAELLFIEGAPNSIVISYDEQGNIKVVDENAVEQSVVLTGKDIDSAEDVLQQRDDNSGLNDYVVTLKLKDSGREKFAEATGRLAGQNVISIWLDDIPISAPSVNEQINDDTAVISGSFTAESSRDLANKINAGALPVPLEVKDYNVKAATMGRDSLTAMALAGAIAFLIVCIFMMIVYRLPGFVACIALLGQVAGSLAVVSGYFAFVPSFTLTLPGIAGIILSIGMGVDANIITAERIKEEMRLGKTIDASLDDGNDNSIASIVDGNVTVIIVAIILMTIFGPPNDLISFLLGPSTTGSIYSFGLTLLAGCIFNFIMGVFASRSMLKSISRFKIFRKRWMYGGAKEK